MPKTTKKTKTGQRIYMSAEELPLQARLREQYAGRFIAWAQDFETFVAVGDDYISARAAALEAGVARPIVEWAEPIPPRPIDSDE